MVDWPSGCHDPASCESHRVCMDYHYCVHTRKGSALGAEISAVIARIQDRKPTMMSDDNRIDAPQAPKPGEMVPITFEEAARLGQTPATMGAPPEAIMRHFAYEHLPVHLQAVSQPFCALAELIVAMLPRDPERTVALRKLLEAKDAAVRARVVA